ncbi:hypothetical protein [Haloplanus halophilus]|uniref:hypothetical protein n=1 Tax=Haloplanus halophilus TaxID=2949993 RepID=UPI00203ABDA6|nr:hypothetical protein [Haloplanus sp. GDY1]
MSVDRSLFAGVFLALLVVVVVATAAVAPPDPYTQLRGIVPGAVVALLVALLVAVGGE